LTRLSRDYNIDKDARLKNMKKGVRALRLQPPVSSVNPMQMAVRKKEPKRRVREQPMPPVTGPK